MATKTERTDVTDVSNADDVDCALGKRRLQVDDVSPFFFLQTAVSCIFFVFATRVEAAKNKKKD